MWNHTNITVIPKLSNPLTVGDFRPISLCNVIYKIVTKSITNRLKVSLEEIISLSQSTFVPGRSILDSVIIGHESLHFIRRKVKGRIGVATIKLDLSKAYGRVEWVFLQFVMGGWGLIAKW